MTWNTYRVEVCMYPNCDKPAVEYGACEDCRMWRRLVLKSQGRDVHGNRLQPVKKETAK